MKRHELVTGNGTVILVHIDEYVSDFENAWDKKEWWVGSKTAESQEIKNLHEYYLKVRLGDGKEIEFCNTSLANSLGYCRPYFGRPKFKIGDRIKFFRTGEEDMTVISD